MPGSLWGAGASDRMGLCAACSLPCASCFSSSSCRLSPSPRRPRASPMPSPSCSPRSGICMSPSRTLPRCSRLPCASSPSPPRRPTASCSPSGHVGCGSIRVVPSDACGRSCPCSFPSSSVCSDVRTTLPMRWRPVVTPERAERRRPHGNALRRPESGKFHQRTGGLWCGRSSGWSRPAIPEW